MGDDDGLTTGETHPTKSPVLAVLQIEKMNLFQQLVNTFGVFSHYETTNNQANEASLSDSSQISTSSVGIQTEQELEKAEKEIADMAEFIASDLIWNIDSPAPKSPPNVVCKTMRRVASDMLKKHEFAFKGMVNKLDLKEENLFSIFMIVSDEIFADGEINWGRIVAVYAFAAKLAMYLYHKENFRNTPDKGASYRRKISMFLGKYVAGKLKHWILRQGGWEDFVISFPDTGEFEDMLWRGLVFTTIGFVALGAMVVSR